MAVVTFDPSEFKLWYPQFAAMPDGQLEGFWATAQLILDNTDRSIVKDIAERKTLLYMLVCHLASLTQRGDAVTGPMTGATEGSVSTSFGQLNWGNGQWYALTQCGLTFWQATAKYRTGGRYYAYRGC